MLPRRAAIIFGAVGVLLIPWAIWLAVRLPRRHLATHYDLAWAGFDIGLAILVTATAAALWRRSELLPLLASVAGTLLFADAWFDITTSRKGDEMGWAIGGAVVAELPLGILCFFVAWRSLIEFEQVREHRHR
jgi:Na+/H+ antiporter NhaA